MGQAAPLVGGVFGAVLGSFVGMPAMGWMLGSAVGGMFMGGPTTPGVNPAAMPAINQSLRGSPMFITFGTNRVSSQLVWTKNWTAVRQKSGGKGAAKGGGSGGGGASKGGGSAGGTYDYSWDLMFHYGIFDVPSYIKNGWIGGDTMDLPTLDAILAGHTAAQAAQVGFFNGRALIGTLNKPKSKLDFTECFYAPGFATDDVALENWAYFEEQEGVECAWPYNTYLAFKTLQLGQTPSIPQLSFEIGPIGGAAFDPQDDGFVNMLTPTEAGGSVWGNDETPQAAVIVGEDGKHYMILDVDGTRSKCKLYCIETASFQTLDLTVATALFVEAGGTIGSSGVSLMFPAPGTPYFFIYSLTGTAHVTYQMSTCRVKIDASGTMHGDGIMTGETSGLAGTMQFVFATAVDNGTCFVAFSGSINLGSDGRPFLQSFPLTGDALASGIGSLSPLVLGFGDHVWEWVTPGSVPERRNRAAIVVDNGSPGVAIYFPQAAVDAASVGNTLLDSLTQPAVYFSAGPVDLSDISGNFGVPFADVMKKHDGTTSTDYNDDWSLNGMGAALLGFTRSYTDKAEQMGVKLFAWNSGSPSIIFDDEIHWWDSVVNGGVLLADRDLATQREILLAWDQASGELFVIGHEGTHTTPRKQDLDTLNFSNIGTLTLDAQDVTPPYIIFRILTDTVWGFGTPLEQINLASYSSVVAECEAQGVKVSVTYTNAGNFLSVIDELCSLYGGYLTDDAGQIKFGMIRTTDVPDPVVIDNSRLISPGKGQPPVQVTKAALQDGYNKVKFNYIDRSLDYKRNQVEVSDEVDIDLNGPRAKEYQPTYVMAGSLAQKIAERSLWTNLYGRDSYAFSLGAKDAHRAPGDLITLVDSFHKDLRNGVLARIVNWKEKKRLTFDVVAVAAIDYQIDASHSFTDVISADPGSDLVSDVVAPFHQTAYELPKEFQDSGPEVFFGYNQASIIMGAQLHVSVDGGASFVLTQDVQPFILSGIFAKPLEHRQQGWCENLIDFYLMPGSGFIANSPTWAQTHDLDDVSQGIRAAGGGVFICGSEALAVENLTLLGQNHYRAQRVFRGWGGTPISTHTSGEFFHYHSAGIFHLDISQDKIGTSIQYKVVPYNFAGQGYNIASIAVSCYTIKGMYWLPRVQPKTKVWVSSAISWPGSADIGETKFLKTVSGGCDVVYTWPQAAQADGFGAGGFGANGFGHFTADVGTPQWRVNVYSSNGFAVRSTVVSTGYFLYDRVTNSADFAGFNQNPWVSVTPRTSQGDGPTTDQRTLNLFW